MENLKAVLATIIICIWIWMMSFTLIKSHYFKKHTEPYLTAHALRAANLFYETCISSNMDFSKLGRNAVKAGMEHLKPLNLPPDTISLKQSYGLWEKDSESHSEKKQKYKAFPYFIDLELNEANQDEDMDSISTGGCRMRMHHGVMKNPSQPYFIPRRSFHDEYTNNLKSILLSRLKSDGSEIIENPWPWSRRRINKPVVYKRDGVIYHLKPDPFSIDVETAERFIN